MQFENILKCHPAYVHLIVEEDILQCDCLSLTDEHKTELMIFLGKVYNSSEYEVRIYKKNPTDMYIPCESDTNLKRCEENHEFSSFFFDEFVFARKFINTVREVHPEFKLRPI